MARRSWLRRGGEVIIQTLLSKQTKGHSFLPMNREGFTLTSDYNGCRIQDPSAPKHDRTGFTRRINSILLYSI